MPTKPHGRASIKRPIRAAAVLIAIFLLHALSPAGDSAWAAEKAIYDVYYDTSPGDATIRAPLLTDFDRLGVKWVRINVNWGLLEPERGSYDTREIARLDGMVDDLRSSSVKVLMGVNCLPSWAQDTAYAGNPGRSYPIRSTALDDFGRLGEYLASHFAGRVRDIEVWNEPNLWASFYPQRTADDPHFAARTYLRMLKAFHAGVHRGDPSIRIVAGATAPIGLNDRLRTSPQRFARFLKDNGAAAYFDVYSHHPYTPGGTMNSAPDGRPNDPSTTVTLYNLRTLLRLFPSKPFYLTEYGYHTASSIYFGGFSVSEATQARYVRASNRLANRYTQVKLLTWFLVRDHWREGLRPEEGSYTGLRRVDGSRKPSWFVYAGGNRVSLLAPERARRGAKITLQGRTTCASIGGVPNRTLTVLGRRLGTKRWYKQATAVTGADGAYSIRVPFRYAAQYRVKWSVVRSSIVRTVRAR